MVKWVLNLIMHTCTLHDTGKQQSMIIYFNTWLSTAYAPGIITGRSGVSECGMEEDEQMHMQNQNKKS